MATRRTLLLLFAAVAALVLVPAPGSACNIPVFRYALDRWPSDAYRLTVFHRGPLAAEQRDLVKSLEKQADDEHPTVAVELVDLAESPKGSDGLPAAPAGSALPWLVVRYPAATRINAPVWSGELRAGVPPALLDSPARRELANRIRGGDSAVWVLLACGDAAKDDAAEKRLRTEVKRLEKELKLPVLTAAPEDKLKEPDRPLKLAFSVLRVGRGDPAEEMLVKMLLNTEDDLTGRKSDPMVFPVFGRGRAMPALVGAGITTENISEAAGFLAGPCSCEVKRDNPGVDLLITAEWGKAAPAKSDAIPTIPAGTAVPIPQAAPAPEPELQPTPANPPASPSPRQLLLAGIGVAGGLVVFTGAMVLRSRRRLPS